MMILSLLRSKQWVKNIFIFAPLFFSFSFTNYAKLTVTIVTFFIFSLASSGIYIINDIFDLKHDQQHPIKKHRPIASGKIPKNKAYILSVFLIVISFLLSYIIGRFLLLIIVLYVMNNLLYSIGFKSISILDVIMVSTGFLLRIFAGGVAANIEISMWILIMTFLLAIFLALAKRRDDVLYSKSGLYIRKNIGSYNLEFINSSMTLIAGVIIVSYLLYSISPEVEQKFHTKYLFVTFLFVAMGLLRYMQITFVENNSGSPTTLLFKDHFLQFVIFSWLTSFYVIVTFF